MDIETLRKYCLAKKGVTEGFPFDEETLVFKVMNKMFALSSLESDVCAVNLKCDPEKAMELREHYDWVLPGWHMNKKHWNTVEAGRAEQDELVYSMIDDSYNLVVSSLKKSDREHLAEL